MPRNDDRQPTAEWLAWQGQMDQLDSWGEKLERSRPIQGEKWYRKVTLDLKRRKEALAAAMPPKYGSP